MQQQFINEINKKDQDSITEKQKFISELDSERVAAQELVEQFNNQSEIKIGKYILDLNSRKINFNEINLDLTEKECDLILFIQSNKKANLKEIQKNVWGYTSDLETHTVETHIYRLRKKIKDKFKDDNFIKSLKDGYQIN